jgi:hypothetical protein
MAEPTTTTTDPMTIPTIDPHVLAKKVNQHG